MPVPVWFEAGLDKYFAASGEVKSIVKRVQTRTMTIYTEAKIDTCAEKTSECISRGRIIYGLYEELNSESKSCIIRPCELHSEAVSRH